MMFKSSLSVHEMSQLNVHKHIMIKSQECGFNDQFLFCFSHSHLASAQPPVDLVLFTRAGQEVLRTLPELIALS